MGLDFYQQPPDPRYEPEALRIAEAKAEAVAAGRELLTPAALSDLFDASPEAIRLARSRGRIEAPLEVMLTGKAVPMTLLGSGVAYWGDPDPGRLHEMRLAGTTLSIDGICYLVLHTGPLVGHRSAATTATAAAQLARLYTPDHRCRLAEASPMHCYGTRGD